jgi:hypothetical protein
VAQVRPRSRAVRPSVAVTALAGMVGSILLAGCCSGRRALPPRAGRSELAHLESVARRITEDRVLELERIARRSRGAPAAQREPIAKADGRSRTSREHRRARRRRSLAWAVPRGASGTCERHDAGGRSTRSRRGAARTTCS